MEKIEAAIKLPKEFIDGRFSAVIARILIRRGLRNGIDFSKPYDIESVYDGDDLAKNNITIIVTQTK